MCFKSKIAFFYNKYQGVNMDILNVKNRKCDYKHFCL